MGKRYSVVEDIKNVPGASTSGTARITLRREDGRLMNTKFAIKRGGALATLSQMRTAITAVRLILSGGALKNPESVRALSAAAYFAILEANGWVNEAGLFPIFLAEPFRATVLDEEFLALEMRRYGKVVLEFDITNDATPLEFSGLAVETSPETKTITPGGKEMLGIISHTVQTDYIGGGSPIINLDPFNGQMNRMFLITADTMTITRVQLLRGQDPIYDIEHIALNPGLKQQLKDFGMVIPAAYTVNGVTYNVWPLVLDNNQQLRNGEEFPDGLRLRIFNTGGGDIEIVRETYLMR